MAVSPIRLQASHVEDLRQYEVATELGAVVIEHHRLCQVHVLVARADAKSKTLPDEVDMARQTLYLRGRWRKAGADGWHDFTWRTDVAWGETLPMPEPLDTAWGGVEVTVQRSLATLFDGIDPSIDSELNAARRVLENVVSDAKVKTKRHLH